MAVIGVDIGGTKVAAVRWSATGPAEPAASHWQVHSLAGRADAGTVVDAIVAAVRAAAQNGSIEAVGVSVAGWLNSARDRVLMAANLGLEQFELRTALAERLGCPVVLDNDGNATAWAEARHGYGRDAGCVVVLALGTGVGGGVVSGGQVLTGGHGMAGELGHLPISGAGLRCVCGGIDCLELYASGPGLARLSRHPDARATLAAAEAGDARAIAALDTAVAAVTQTVGILIPVLDPDCVVLAGSVAAAIGDRLSTAVTDALTVHPLSVVLSAPDVRLSRLGPSAAAIGAAELAGQFFLDLEEGKVHV